MIMRSKAEQNGSDGSKPPLWLQNASLVATIALALVAVIGALVATIHFTIQVDVTPALIRLEDRQSVIEVRLNGIDQRLNNIDQRLERIETAVIGR